jgi:hypothetical protein
MVRDRLDIGATGSAPCATSDVVLGGGEQFAVKRRAPRR